MLQMGLLAPRPAAKILGLGHFVLDTVALKRKFNCGIKALRIFMVASLAKQIYPKNCVQQQSRRAG